MKNKTATVTAGALITCLVLMWVFHGHSPLPDATEVGPVREATHQQPIPAKSATTPDHEDVYKPATESTTHAVWPGSSIQESVEEEPDPTGTFTRITVVQPRQLPYPVRIEERIRINPQGEEVVEERFEVVADQVLARPLYGKEAEFLNLVQAEGLETERLSQTGIYRIHLANSRAYAVPAALDLLGQWNNLLAYCETDDIVRPTAIPDDPAYGDGSLWGMHNTGQNEGVLDSDGLSNKLEFALRTNPLLTDSEATAPTGHLVSEDDSLYLHYSYRRRAGDGSGSTLTGYTIDGITYSLKTATPLDSTTWLSGPGFFEEPSPPVDNGDGTETVTVKVLQPAGVDGPFVRLLIE